MSPVRVPSSRLSLHVHPSWLCAVLLFAALLLGTVGEARGSSRVGRALDPFVAESDQVDTVEPLVEEAPVRKSSAQPRAVSQTDAPYAQSMSAVTAVGVDAAILPDSSAAPFASFVDAGAPASESPSTPAAHSMHVMQATAAFTVERLTAQGPWSNRIQPGFAYRDTPLTYLQHSTGINITASPGYLLMWEGAFRATYQGRDYIENDIWLSNDDMTTSDLIGGHSLFGRSGDVRAVNNVTFVGRSGSNNCADPIGPTILSIGGRDVTGASSRTVYRSVDARRWTLEPPVFAPGRHFTSCDIDETALAYIIGGHTEGANGEAVLLNDIWKSSVVSDLDSWRRLTAAAPFSAREEHLVLIANSTALRRELIYVIGGKTQCTNFDCYDGFNSNDVWASSDQAQTWTLVNARPPFGPRWGHGGIVTKAGVLVVWGGMNSLTGAYTATTTYRDVWASFDGGYTWRECNVPGTDAQKLWIRGEQGAVVNAQGHLVLAAGYGYGSPPEAGFQVRYRDVWRTTFSLEDTRALAARCGGLNAIPAAGAGMRTWPGAALNERNVMSFTAITRRAPWSARIQPEITLMRNSRSYVSSVDGTTATTGTDWLVMFEGSIRRGTNSRSAENDVWASADSGVTWALISGIAYYSLHGLQRSAQADSSFSPRGGAANCEDPSNDDLYSMAGVLYADGNVRTQTAEVWFSSNAIEWVQRRGRGFGPERFWATCVVDDQSTVFLIGGQRSSDTGGATTYYRDIWTSSDQAVTWDRLTTNAPFMARSEHTLAVTRSAYYGRQLMVITGGQTLEGATLNDVWVSSDRALTWAQVTNRAAWPSRWGHASVITEAGAMLVLGGVPGVRGNSWAGNSFSDAWLSLDGGLRWTSCRLPINNVIVRAEQGAVLTQDEHLLLGAGYQVITSGGTDYYRPEFSDLWRSDQPLSDLGWLTRVCSTAVPDDGVIGLRDMEAWVPETPATSSSSSSSGLSSGVLVMIVVAVVAAVLSAAYYLYCRKQRTGVWSPFAAPTMTETGQPLTKGHTSDAAVPADEEKAQKASVRWD